MKDLIARSKTMVETAESQKGMLWILELLLFIGVFLVSTCAEGFVQLPASMFAMYTDSEYLEAASSGDPQRLIEISQAVSERMMSKDWYMVLMLFSTALMIGVVFLFCRFLQKRKLRTLGFVKHGLVKEYLLGVLLGFLFFSACVGLALLTGGLKFDGFSETFSIGIFILYLLGYMVQGMAEEVLCRGYFLGSYARRYPVYAAVLANALLFAALHLMNSGISVLAFVNLTLFGIFASLYFIQRGSIWGIGAFHSIWNLVQGNFYGIRVSGMKSSCSVFSMTPVEGKELFSGGAFGIEGSLICTIVLSAGIVGLFILLIRGKTTADPSASSGIG